MIAVDLRPGPSANLVLVGDVLVDTGSAGTLQRTRAFLDGATPSWVALTHFHADHAGGAGTLGLPVAAHEAEAALVNAGDPRAGDPWLGFEIPPYRVTRALRDGDLIGELEVVHTPGQTPGHVAYWHAGERVAITGDLLQNGDVAWVPFGGPWAEGALDRDDRVGAADRRFGSRLSDKPFAGGQGGSCAWWWSPATGADRVAMRPSRRAPGASRRRGPSRPPFLRAWWPRGGGGGA